MPDSTALAATLDLAAAFAGLRETGAAYIPDALTTRFHDELAAEVAGGEFSAMSGYAGVAQQEGEVLRIRRDLADYPLVTRLRDELIERVQTDGADIAGLRRWEPNEVDVQRYAAGALGITPHLDHKRYHVLIAICTLGASAPFTVCADRSGTVHTRWQAAPRSLVLLRAPGFAGTEDGRPLHTVSGPDTGERISVSLRMNTR